MSRLTKNFEEFNREHPVMDGASAELLASSFPETEHLYLEEPGSQLDSSLAEQKDGSQVVALLPANKTSKVQNALAEAFQSLLKSKNNLAAVDMDISSPRSELLGVENSEGLTDHFLYGVSPSKILRDSNQPGLKVITPGTFTPRAVEIYENPRWKSLIKWLTKETGLTVVLLAPPMERLKDLPPLMHADTVILFSEPLPKDQPPEELQRIMEAISRNSAPESSIRMLWLGEREAEPEAPETAEAGVEEPATEELDTAELEMEEEPEQIEVPELEPTETLEAPEEPAAEAPVEEPEPEELETAELEMEEEPEQIEVPELESTETLEAPEEPAAEAPVEEPEPEELETAELEMEEEPEQIEVPEPESTETLEAPEEPAAEAPVEEPEPEELETAELEMEEEPEQIEVPELESTETLEAPEEPAAEAPVEEPEPEELETAELEMEEEPEQIEVPELESTETLEAPEEPAGVDLKEVPVEELGPVTEAQTEEPTPAPEAEKSLKDEEDRREDQDPEEPEPPVSAAETEAPAAPAAAEPAEDHEPPEEEIFLPDELLFLDEEETPAGTGKGSDKGLEAEQLVGLNYDELPDMKTLNDKEDQPSEPEKAAPALAREDQDAVTADAGASTEKSSSAEPGDIDPEALYTETDPEDEPPSEELAQVSAEPVDEARSAAAMAKMESFQESLNASPDEGLNLPMDTDPLAEEKSPAEDSGAETPETGEPAEPETAPEAEEIETLEEVELEPTEETAVEETEPETVEPAEAEAAPEAEGKLPAEEVEAGEPAEAEAVPEAEEIETLEEVELEPAEETAAEETEPEAAAEAEEIETLEEVELEPAEETAAEETEPEAVPEAEEIETLEEVELEPAEENAAEETEPEAAAEAEEIETLEEVELEPAEETAAEETEPEAAAEETAAEPLEGEAATEPVESAAEPAAEELVELDDEGAPAAATAGESAAEDELAGVETDEDVLPHDESEIEGDELDIDLGELEGEEVVQPVQKKKPAKSKSRPVVLLVLVLVFLSGMFYVWQQGIVSQLVRDHFPNLAGMLGISSSSLPEQVMGTVGEQEEAEGAQETAAIAQQEEELESLRYPTLAFSIQLGSFRFLNRAIEARDQLTDRGLRNAYVVSLKLDSLGDWNRLYLGFYGTKAAADTALSKAGGTLRNFAGDAIIRETPYALLIGDFPTADALNLKRDRLTENNIPSYSVLLKPDSTQTSIYRLFVGAFENKEQAIIMRTRLYNLGLKAEIAERRGGTGITG